MQKKPISKTKFDLTDKHHIAELHQALIDIETKHPAVFSFLEEYCGFYMPVLSADPYEISYSGGKRDVILTIKTLMRKDISPEQIAQYYKNL